MSYRIALISDHASPLAMMGGVDSGGQNVYVGHVARQLAMQGYRVDVFTRRDSPALAERVDWSPGVRVIHVPAGPPAYVRKEDLLPTMDEFAAFVLAFCRAEGAYALTHANFFMSGLVAMRLKQALGIPYIVTFHALGRVRLQYQREADQFPPQRLAIEDAVIADADGIVAECPQDELDLVGLYGADPARIRVIPCGFDRTEFWPVPRKLALRALGLAPDARVLVNIGRLVPRKGIANAVRGLARLVRGHGVAATLIVVGGNSDQPDAAATPEIGRLRSIAAGEGVAERVVFVGRRSREQLKLYYSAATAFVTTPWYEPFGITPLEAMACGTPVIGARVGGIKYSVVDGETGYLVAPDDPESLAARAAELCRDPALVRRMGGNGIRRTALHFTWEGVGSALARFYADACASLPQRQRQRIAAW